MKVLSVVLSIVLSSSLWATGIDFHHGTLEEAKEIAADQGRLIFVDAFTTWCGPCKRMAKNVFTAKEVGDFYNENFINVKLDMEKGEGRTFQKQYGVRAFPTLLFIDPQGKLVHRVVGGMDVKNFLSLGRFAASKSSSVSSELDEAYKKGARDPEFMLKYIGALAKAKRPLLKIANQYLDAQKDLSTEENLKIIYLSTVEADSRIFTKMVDHQDAITSIYGTEAVHDRIEAAGNKTVQKAIKFENEDLLHEAIDKIKRFAADRSKSFTARAKLTYYGALKDHNNYHKVAKSYARQGVEQKFELANFVLSHMQDDPKLMQSAEVWALDACKAQKSEPYCFTAAKLLLLNGKPDQALAYAREALSFSEKAKSGAKPHIEKLIKTLERSKLEDKS
ncbi:MAG: thioredoxin family protein [Saprospiraceae bacterium]|nr:thioredoxin family protein [Saprospiraceae bacterium]